MEELLLNIQERLKHEIPELEYIGKDMGQLSDGNTEMVFPCALLDLKNIGYTQEGNGTRMADIRLAVTVAHSQDPSTGKGYNAIGLIEDTDTALHLFAVGDFTPLFCTEIKKMTASGGRECYEMTYRTFLEIGHDTGWTKKHIQNVKLDIK